MTIKQKYIDNKITMAIPAQLPEGVVNTMRQNAEIAFRAIGGLGLSRCDFFIQKMVRSFSTSSIPCQASPSGLCIHCSGKIWG